MAARREERRKGEPFWLQRGQRRTLELVLVLLDAFLPPRQHRILVQLRERRFRVEGDERESEAVHGGGSCGVR